MPAYSHKRLMETPAVVAMRIEKFTVSRISGGERRMTTDALLLKRDAIRHTWAWLLALGISSVGFWI
jgi:hypothetical protein